MRAFHIHLPNRMLLTINLVYKNRRGSEFLIFVKGQGNDKHSNVEGKVFERKMIIVAMLSNKMILKG